MTTITFEEFKGYLTKDLSELNCDEYYDGLTVDFSQNKYLIPCEGEELPEIQKYILDFLPNSNLVKFSYTSRFSCETDFEHLKSLPITMTNIHLCNIRKLECNIKDIELIVDDFDIDDLNKIPNDIKSLNIKLLNLQDKKEYNKYIKYIDKHKLLDKIIVEEFGDYSPDH